MDSLKRFVPSAFLLASFASVPVAHAGSGTPAASGERAAPPSSKERAAADVERSEELFRRGTRAFEEARYSEAYGALRSAWDLAPNYRTAAGLGQVELHLGQYRDAAEHLSYCVRHYPADGDARIRAHVEQGLEQARERVAAVRVRVNVEGADIAVDGVAAGKSPVDGLLFVEPGQHEVTASQSGKVARAQIEGHVRATEEVSLTIPIEGEAPPVPAPAPAPSPTGVEARTDDVVAASHGLRPSTWALIVGGSLTAVALGTSIAFHVKGNGADDDASALKSSIGNGAGACAGGGNASCTALEDKLDERNSANKVALGAAIGTGVFAAATAVTFFVLRSSERSSSGSAQPLAFGFRAAQGGGVLSLHGGF